jgi:hypothetical protein
MHLALLFAPTLFLSPHPQLALLMLFSFCYAPRPTRALWQAHRPHGFLNDRTQVGQPILHNDSKHSRTQTNVPLPCSGRIRALLAVDDTRAQVIH